MGHITVKEIVIEYLKQHKCDGLCFEDCGCELDNFIPCDNLNENCIAAKKGIDENGEGTMVPVEIRKFVGSESTFNRENVISR